MTQPTDRPAAIVAGGGLAGMTAARQLQLNGFDATLLEASPRLGGKAGSRPGEGNPAPDALYEHGYHIFAPWYRNMLALTEKLGVDLTSIYEWHYLTEGQAGWSSLFLPTSIREILQILKNSPLPAPDTLLYFYFVLDMIGMPISRKAALDRVSRLGLMRSRWYVTNSLPDLEAESILKAAAVPVHEMSAYTAKILSSYFLGAMRPFRGRQPALFILPGDLQENLIEPYRRQLTDDGVTVLCEHEVIGLELEESGGTERRVERVGVRRPDGSEVALSADVFVIATPLGVAQQILNGLEHHVQSPTIGRINQLRTAPMAALQLSLTELPDLPDDHAFLVGGEYGLSLIALTNQWERDAPYNLSVISSNFTPLMNLDLQEQYALLMGEIRRYLPIDDDHIAHWSLFPNTGPTQQLFVNTVGSWPNRPSASLPETPNLFFAGDWVKNPIDLACMEGTVVSALEAAHRITKAWASASRGVTAVPPPETGYRWPPLLIRLFVFATAPLAAVVWLWSKLLEWRK